MKVQTILIKNLTPDSKSILFATSNPASEKAGVNINLNISQPVPYYESSVKINSKSK
jgi:hypothetical protein